MTREQQDFRKQFLKQFVYYLIWNSKKTVFKTEKGFQSIKKPEENIESDEQIHKSITETKLKNAEENIEFLLKDPLVTIIECIGPNKPFVVHKGASVHLSQVILTNAEINEYVNDFAKKANTEVHGGVLKTTLKNITLTAVLSDYVGGRFILQKP